MIPFAFVISLPVAYIGNVVPVKDQFGNKDVGVPLFCCLSMLELQTFMQLERMATLFEYNLLNKIGKMPPLIDIIGDRPEIFDVIPSRLTQPSIED